VEVSERFFVGRDTLRSQLRTVIKERFDGVIFRLSDGGWEWDAEAAELERAGIPFVVGEIAPQGVAVAAEDWHDGTGQVVAHLAAEGHKELVLLGSLRRAHRSMVVKHAYQERCLRLGLTASAARVIELAAHTTEAVKASCAELLEQHAGATALVIYDEDHVDAIMEALREMGCAVPDQLSVVAIGDGANARNARPPVTTASFDSGQLGHLVLDQVCRMIEQGKLLGRTGAKPRVLLGAGLHARASVRSVGAGLVTDDEASLLNQNSRPWPKDTDARRREAEAMRHRAHRTAQGATGEFLTLDLKTHANRSLTRQNGWLGQFPLLHMAPGRQLVHGVPFDVINEQKNGGRAAIVPRSLRISAGQAVSPVKVTIPVGMPVKAVYFLHGCGFVGTQTPFAWYDFALKGKRTVTVPLVARGLGKMDDGQTPNIQDWWSDFPQIDGPGVLPLVVTENGDPFLYERYLYTLEWENPHPDAVLDAIHISSNPVQPTTLGVLAVTVLKA
jgi:DNA-binding LacI/PurR family transcriptional regulator